MSRSKLLAAALGLAWTFAAGVAMAAAGMPRVVAVSPSGRAVPENLLRISIRFDAAPEGQILRRLARRPGAARRCTSLSWTRNSGPPTGGC